MPTYEYACTDCGERLEVVQKFTDDALTVCPRCEGRLRKMFNAVGIVFKGSGFYRTDSRGSNSVPAKAGDKTPEKTSEKSSEKSSEKAPEKTKSDKPASSPAPTAAPAA
ncbi:FmdB family transcriptional regulator [Streptosporangiaceae bacterium NEAU-GS5]|nr:FmdB family transcriptional regulator [Streptosporangiaceae bacterium NEAU-GS5]